ncbi:hypothetical protein WH367_07360 [Comamonas sp. MYb21]|uniref:hypothetical protein n=1 Tax=Comamonas sp. MYb21 TaxID=1848648 RepID=UPI00309F08F1
MANSLIKEKVYVPGEQGQEYRPARPARDIFVDTMVCGMRPVSKNVPGRYKYVTNPATGQVSAIFVPDKKTGTVTLVSEIEMTYACWEEKVLVHLPADPGQKGVAARAPGWDYALGWENGARSLMFVTGDASATFQGRASLIGAVVGLNGYEDPVQYTGLTTAYGFYLAKGLAKVMELGQAKTGSRPYTDATVFKIERVEGVVSYFLDDELVYTSSTTGSTQPLWLQAALYAGDDEIFNPMLTQISPPDTSPVTGELTLRLPPANVAFDKGQVLRLVLGQAKPAMSFGKLAAPSFALLSFTLPPVLPYANALVGAVGQLALTLPPVNLAASDREIGRLKLPLPAPTLYGRNWPYGELPGTFGRLMLDGKISLQGLVTLQTKPMRAVLSGSVSPYAEATLQTVVMRGMLSGDMTAMGEVTLPVVPMRAVLSGKISILSGLGEVFAMNITGGNPGGTTRYERYPYNSYATIGGKHYGASEEGLFLLDGDDDAGQPIEAVFGMGQLDFGSPQVKILSYCYLGAAAGSMRLQIDSLLNGRPASYTYPARGHGASMREVRFDLGRGLRSAYATPTFKNSNGDAFEVDAIRFVVNESNRRI